MQSRILYAKQIAARLVEAGYSAYFAGGWVRDLVLGTPSEDIDIATDAPPEAVIALFPRTLLVGVSFGVVVVLIEGQQFEVSTFRKDIGYVDGRRPEAVEWCAAEEDAKRRDFTINGMFYDPASEKILDFVGGQEDLRKGLIRTIGNPEERFSEDRLRMLRAIRFASRFDFAIDPMTSQAISKHANTLFPAVAKERVWHELAKMSRGPRFANGLVEMHRLGLLQTIFSPLAVRSTEEVEFFVRPFADMGEDVPTALYLHHLFPHDPFEVSQEQLLALKVSNRELEWLEVMFAFKNCLEEENDVSWAHYFADPRAEMCLNVYSATLSYSDKINFDEKIRKKKEDLALYIERIARQNPWIKAEQLKNLGIKPGPKMGELLKEAEKLAITRRLNSSETVLEALHASPLWPNNPINKQDSCA